MPSYPPMGSRAHGSATPMGSLPDTTLDKRKTQKGTWIQLTDPPPLRRMDRCLVGHLQAPKLGGAPGLPGLVPTLEDGGLAAARAVLTSSAALLCPGHFPGSNTTRDVTRAELEGDSECRRVLRGLSIITHGGRGRARRPQHQT